MHRVSVLPDQGREIVRTQLHGGRVVGVLLRFDFETQKPEQAMLGLLRHMEMLCCNYDFASSAVIAWLNASACVSQSEYSGSSLRLGSRLLSDR